MKITFLLHNAYAIGGTVRSTLNLAGALAGRHEVEVVSMFRTEERPPLGVSGKVHLVPLVDERPDSPSYDGGHEPMSRPSAVVPPTEVLAHRYTALVDERLRAFLATTDADVVIATRPALVVFLASLAEHGSIGASGSASHRRPLLIGQEHLSYDNHVAGVRTAQNEAIAHLDAFVTVSARDAADHRRRLPGVRARITNIANAAPRPRAEPSDLRAPLVVAAGRLYPVKRYDLLIEAFAKVAAERPEWRLRIYGKGPERAALRAAVDRLALNDHVFLMGPHATLETEWAKASVAAVSSEWESFGMTILEAMHAGVPVVSTDCPHGPGEIITDDSDGLLVPPGDPDALTTALLRLIDDTDLRHRLGTTARTTVQRYAPHVIAAEYEQLIGELRETRRPAAVKLAGRVRRGIGTRWPRRAGSAAAERSAAAAATGGGASAGTGQSTGSGVPKDSWRTAGPEVPRSSGAPAGAAKPTSSERVDTAEPTPSHPTAPAGSTPSAPVTPGMASDRAPVVQDARARPLRPKADCRVDAEGGVRISIGVSGVSGEGGGADSSRHGPALALRRRHSDDEFRVPLGRESADDAKSPWTVTLDRADLTLAEGRWDLHVERTEDGTRRRARAGLVEQRGLLGAAAKATAIGVKSAAARVTAPGVNAAEAEGSKAEGVGEGGPVTWWIPYPTKDGYLALRTFHRPAHAEVTALPIGEGTMSVVGVLYGAELGAGAALVGVARGDDLANFETPATAIAEHHGSVTGGHGGTATGEQDGTTTSEHKETATGRHDGTAADRHGERLFQARLTTLPEPTDPDGASLWDLFLRPSSAAEPIRLGRLFGDIVDRKDTDKYPAVTLTPPGSSPADEPPHASDVPGPPQARFFFTVTNDLAVSLSASRRLS